MKKSIILFLIIVIPVFFLGYMYLNSDNQKDKRIWNEFRKQLVIEQIEKVSVESVILSVEEKTKVIKWLEKAKFKESNKIGEGPTSEKVVTVQFKNGTFVYFGYWGGDTFESSPRHIDLKAQFLIKSKELGIWINSASLKSTTIKPLETLQPNEFYANDIKKGDQIIGLTVSSIERDTIEPGSIVVHFDGELHLKGSFIYYTKEQLAQENYYVYLTIDPISLRDYPRVKFENMNVDYPVRIGIANSAKHEDLFGPAGTTGIMDGTFSHFILVHTPHKPAEGSIELNKATVHKK
jgi:hypothetical protein